jgi:hypothetical protein
MSYTINKTTGEVLITLLDGTADGPDINPGLNTSDLDLFGKNYPLYGQYQNENFVKLLQNFANVTAPSNPLEGELWYDISTSGNHILRVFNGTSWLPVTPVWVSTNAPTTNQVGAQWWDSTNFQLNMYNGSGWTVVGPAYKAPDGKSGSLVETVVDTNNISHSVIKFYTNNNVLAIASFDQPFVLNDASTVAGFSVISPGITLAAEANNLFYGTATNSQQLGNIAALNYARNDIDSLFSGNITLGSGNLVISTATGTSRLINTVNNGNISLYTNIGGTSTRVLTMNGVTGEVTAPIQSPTNAASLTTKTYVDTNISNAILPLATIYSPAFTGVPTAPNVSVYTANTAQIATMNSVWGAIGAGFNDTILQGNIRIWANAVTPTLALSVDSSTGAIVVNADPTTNLGVATKSYVDTSISTAISPLATIDSPGFTGTVTAPNVAINTDRTNKVATTAFVQNAVAASTSALWLGSRKTVSTVAPTNGDGDTGDFWFQI